MSLSAGIRLGPYEIVAPLGAGGMGEVYRARDTKLNREVAIKVLPESLAADGERRARFSREAQVLASLNHPNVAQIHGFEDFAGLPALVMELVEGPTLSDRIGRNPIPIDAALPIAKQIAEALEAAHEQGIVHRDLKPANIKVRADGTVKVLDFGLAKALDTTAASNANLTQSPTLAMPAMVTGLGTILGTAAYMSPEQARGKPVDTQTDIWAFGCVLYEMFTGGSAFGGETISDTIAKILEREPDWRLLAAFTPVRIRELVRRCLEKDQQRRLHHIADARIEIEDVLAARSRPHPLINVPLAWLAAAVMLAILVAGWMYAEKSVPSAPHEPVSILIADFQNTTGDPAFDHALEPMVRLALEGAGFISAYDRNRIRSAFGLTPPEKLDEREAREIAVRQGVAVVLAGSIGPRGNGYDVSIKAIQALTGKELAADNRRASTKNGVLETATKVVSTVREILGDSTTSDTAQVLAMRSISSNSLEVAAYYAAALEAQYKTDYEEARRNYLKALEEDPTFGLGYQGLAAMSLNLRNLQDAEKYSSQALKYLDGMTERERFSARGFYYQVRGDLSQCVKEYGDVLARYPADATAHNQRAICFARMRDMRAAMDEMRLALQILPNRTAYRFNLALFTTYAGDFAAAERDVRAVRQPTSRTLFALALTQVGQGKLQEAAETYEKMRQMDAFGKSYSASGLGDLALYRGRLSNAVRILEEGARADWASNNADSAAMKLTSIAYAHLMMGQGALAVAAAGKALQNSKAMQIRLLAGRVLAETGEIAKARVVADELESELPAEPKSYGKIIQGVIALNAEDASQAVKLLTDANGLVDTWLGHFDLGRAYLRLRAFPQADSEFDRCIQRHGEALALFDAEPTSGHYPVAHYYQGRAREGLGTAGFADAYRTYLDIRGESTEDPLVVDARRRLAQ
jgi:tetratricopeptide (TPR) repeat protein